MKDSLKWVLISMGILFYWIISYYHDPHPGDIPLIFLFSYFLVKAFLEYIKYSNQLFICIFTVAILMASWIMMVNEISHMPSIAYIILNCLTIGFVTLIMLLISLTCLESFMNKIKKIIRTVQSR